MLPQQPRREAHAGHQSAAILRDLEVEDVPPPPCGIPFPAGEEEPSFLE